MKQLTLICRIIFGLVFMLSGFVKAIDPLGSAYKFLEYFAVFDLQFLDPLALFFSILLSSLEFIIGAAILFNQFIKFCSLGGLLFMLFFTPLTLYISLTNPVADCGCFGSLLVITNWQTFIKNIFLLTFALIIFLRRNKIKTKVRNSTQWSLITIYTFIIVFIAIYSYRHLPLIDFGDYKAGTSMKIDDTIEEKFYVTYKNKQTGELKEYLSPNFPWDDPEWVANWEFVSQRIKGAALPKNIIFISSHTGEDFTKSITQNQNLNFLLLIHDLEKANFKKIDLINKFAQTANQNSIEFVALTGSSISDAEEFKIEYNPNFEIYFADQIVLKTVVRSNPGLVLMKDGVILKKWHHNDFPVFEEINFKELENRFLKN